MARTNPHAQATEPTQHDAPGPRFRHPEPLTQEDLDGMERLLPARPTEAILRWIAGEGPDPWSESSD